MNDATRVLLRLSMLPLAAALAALPSRAATRALGEKIGSIANQAGMPSATEKLDLLSVDPPTPKPQQKKTHYQELLDLYNVAELPQTEDLAGWFSGRCFGKYSPNTAKGGLLIGGMRLIPNGDNGQNGPLFPPIPKDTQFRFTAFQTEDKEPPNFYDHPTAEIMTIIQNDLNMEKPSYLDNASEIHTVSGSLAMRFFGAYYRARKYGSYLIVLRAYDEGAADLDQACYFFKP